MRSLRRSLPTPPTNVQLHYPDGRAVPVECVYDGEKDGQHVWRMVLPETFDLELEALRVTCETLPARTSLAIYMHQQ
jgi:hypothetical protein